MGDDQRRRYFQNHEVIAAHLREHAALKQIHHHDLSEEAGMDSAKSLKSGTQLELFRPGELDAAKQPEPADFLDHLVTGERLTQALAQIMAEEFGAAREIFLLENLERGETGAHGQSVFAVRGCVHDRALERVVDG